MNDSFFSDTAFPPIELSTVAVNGKCPRDAWRFNHQQPHWCFSVRTNDWENMRRIESAVREKRHLNGVSGTFSGVYTRKSGKGRTYDFTATWEPKGDGIVWKIELSFAGAPKGEPIGYVAGSVDDIEFYLKKKAESAIEDLIWMDE